MVGKRSSKGLVMFWFMRAMSINAITQKEVGILSTDPFKAFDKVSFVLWKEFMSFPVED